MSIKKIIFIILLLQLSLSFAQPIGKIVGVTNKVIAQKGNTQRVLKSGSPIYKDEAIITETQANTTLQYTNGTQVAIQQNSNFTTLNYAPKAEQKLKAVLNKGAIEYHSTGKKKGIIQTPLVALAIQGTQFKLISTPDKTYVQVTEGEVRVGNQVLSPSQQFSSGSFDKNGKFTPGSIPWEAYTGGTTQEVSSDNNNLSVINELTMNVIETVNTSSAIDGLMEMASAGVIETATTITVIPEIEVVELAAITVTGCS